MENIQEILDNIHNSELARTKGIFGLLKRSVVYVYKLELVEEIKSVEEATEKYGSVVKDSLRDGVPVNNLFFSYSPDGKKERKKTTKGTKIKAFYDGREFGIYESVQQAAIQLKIHRTCIQHTLSGKYKSYKGYTFIRL